MRWLYEFSHVIMHNTLTVFLPFCPLLAKEIVYTCYRCTFIIWEWFCTESL